ncbi:protein of unknown function [Aminobacter niigataensis]|nr:protein of unknown function [Aminobacter niigataensis]
MQNWARARAGFAVFGKSGTWKSIEAGGMSAFDRLFKSYAKHEFDETFCL